MAVELNPMGANQNVHLDLPDMEGVLSIREAQALMQTDLRAGLKSFEKIIETSQDPLERRTFAMEGESWRKISSLPVLISKRLLNSSRNMTLRRTKRCLRILHS